ncbi:Uncharacterised protein [Porphyromonas cangingivalis]|uniref:Uncharacterized protein n=1 Tax=Porphyromonas cangingivalis TaxID=36874 RepID=A0A1T4M2I2_PORCN|nr:hypothetical protein SAMN02745205_01362 [Porphyromonas cangingivalis]VEJ03812.1 Uncharacterised protein [Porphyromonas cangingivalis]
MLRSCAANLNLNDFFVKDKYRKCQYFSRKKHEKVWRKHAENFDNTLITKRLKIPIRPLLRSEYSHWG